MKGTCDIFTVAGWLNTGIAKKSVRARLVVLAMVINTEGFIKYFSILEGNTSDPSSLPDMIEQLSLKSHSSKNRSLVVLDAGIATLRIT